ncbi:MAG: DUF192 domain-containing protein [Reyranellaceae bacterium]
MRRIGIGLLAAIVLALAGMAGPAGAQQPASQSAPAVTFERDTLAIRTSGGEIKFDVELARTQAQKQRGLMFREKLDPYTGMLFDFGAPQVVSMWMMNTLIPLDMIFIDAKGKIISIAANTKPMSTDTILSGGQALGVLEIAGGSARLLGIKPGDTVVHPMFGNR